MLNLFLISGSRSVNIGGPNFEFYMDVAPGSITIDSLEATVVTNANSNNPNEVNGKFLYFLIFLNNLSLIVLFFIHYTVNKVI